MSCFDRKNVLREESLCDLTPKLKNCYHPLVAILFFFFLWHFGFSLIEKRHVAVRETAFLSSGIQKLSSLEV